MAGEMAARLKEWRNRKSVGAAGIEEARNHGDALPNSEEARPMPSPIWKLESVWMAFACCGVALCEAADMPPLKPRVELEENVYTNTPANNGAGPMWCSGSTTLVRVGDVVYATGLETIPNEPPLNNCRWTLFRRAAEGWTRIHADTTGKTREPSPLITLGDGQVVVSANPTLAQGPTPNGGPARPELWTFATS